jgi:transcriptional regulator with XRE-family HTH domain
MEKEDCIKLFIRNIRTLRMQEGLSLTELGKRSGVPLWMLEELEDGTLSDEMMLTDTLRLAEVFHCKIRELFQ